MFSYRRRYGHSKFARRSRRILVRPRRRPRTSKGLAGASYRPGGGYRSVECCVKPHAQFGWTGLPIMLPYHGAFGDAQANGVVSGPLTTAASVATSEVIYQLNSPYSPRYSGTGGSAEMWATWQNFYKRYIITHVDLEICFYEASTNAGLGVVLVQPSNGSTTISGQSAGRILQDNNYETVPVNGTTYGDGQRGVYKRRIFLWQLEGLTYLEYLMDKGSYSGAINGNPAQVPYVRIGFVDPNANSATANATIKITYHGKLYKRDNS